MKNSIKKMMLPLLAFLLAVGFGFATANSSEALVNLAPVDGYLDHDQPCVQRISCQTTGDEICTSGEQQAKAFNSAKTSCDVEVYKLEP